MRNPFPYILAWLTQHPRVKYEVEKEVLGLHSITHSLFVMYRKIFWRRQGIRAEASANTLVDESGVTHVTYRFFSKEALICHMEVLVREYVKSRFKQIKNTFAYWQWKIDRLLPQIGQIFDSFGPQFAFEGLWTSPPIDKKGREYAFAIAFVSELDTTSTNPSAFDATSADFLVVNVNGSAGTADATLVTYHATTMALVATQAITNNTLDITWWVLHAPASGSNNILVTQVGGTQFGTQSYSGVNQADVIDSSASGATGSGTGVKTTSITIVNANSWGLGTVNNQGTDNDNTNAGGLTFRAANTPGRTSQPWDTNGPLSTGAHSLGFNYPSGSANGVIFLIAIPPPLSAATTTGIPTLLMVGVG